jgi:hypothetical protein
MSADFGLPLQKGLLQVLHALCPSQCNSIWKRLLSTFVGIEQAAQEECLSFIVPLKRMPW